VIIYLAILNVITSSASNKNSSCEMLTELI